MKLGFGLYRHMLNEEHYKLAKKCGATHLVVHFVDYFGNEKNNFEGVLIPDHTPQMSCAAPWHAGMAYAMGYMKAAISMVNNEK